MSLNVDHNVAIVTVLDLKDVANETVGGQGLTEVGSSLLEF